MLRIGLTGGIGSGKSTVARLLAGRGAVVADADAMAREVVAPGTTGLARVDAEFPGVVVGGELDRAALAAVVFADPERRRALEAVTHPLIAARTAEIAASVPDGGVLVHDVPLLVERGMAAGYDLVLVVEAPMELRLRRLAARGLAPDEARARMAHQATDAERRAVADVVLDNGGTEADLAAQVDRMWRDRVVS
jgi:dephospho-CoA kinase